MTISLQVFEDDLQKRNQIHCLYMQGLGHLGVREMTEACVYLTRVLELDPNHQGTRVHLVI